MVIVSYLLDAVYHNDVSDDTRIKQLLDLAECGRIAKHVANEDLLFVFFLRLEELPAFLGIVGYRLFGKNIVAESKTLDRVSYVILILR